MAEDGERALREWLRGCPALRGRGLFGAEFLGDSPGDWGLFSLPGAVKYRENILGKATPLSRQSREFALALRGEHGAQASVNLESLALLREVAEWVLAQGAAGNLPLWPEGAAVAVVPATHPAPERFGNGDARYALRLRVEYRAE